MDTALIESAFYLGKASVSTYCDLSLTAGLALLEICMLSGGQRKALEILDAV